MSRKTTRSHEVETKWEDVIRPVAGSNQLKTDVAQLAESLRKRHAHALGFLPRNTYATAIERDRMVATLENDELCGILLWARRKQRIKIHQTVIAEDARRLLHATHAVEAILDHEDAKGAEVLQLRVATDLPALRFWEAIGMRKIYTVKGKLWKGRQIAVMRMSLAQPRARKEKMIKNLIDLAIRKGEI